MKKVKLLLFSVVLLIAIVIAILSCTSKIQDVTLATNDIFEFNEGWQLEKENTTLNIECLPYYGKASKGETVVLHNKVTNQLCGKTLSFLSADKTVQILIDNEEIYSFGLSDKYLIGHTPGSVMVFADIPENALGKEIKIVCKSPYKDYAAYFTKIVAGERDVTILYFIKQNLFSFIISISILFVGVLILLFAFIQHFMGEKSLHLFGIAIYLFILVSYHNIETKIPMVFYGNQYLYSNLVFLCLMTATLFSGVYLLGMVENKYKKFVYAFLCISLVNIVAQITLQFLNVFDFMEMSFLSHGLIMLFIINLIIMQFSRMRKHKSFDISIFGIFAMAIGAAIDIVRSYIIHVGDLGKYSRIGLLIFGICELIICIRSIMQRQIKLVQTAQQEQYSSEIIKTLITAIDAKDVYTKGHSARVSEYSVILAKELGWNEEAVNNIKYKALLHDVGKIGVPDRVLNKADRLTDEEYNVIKTHTIIGAQIIEGVESLSDMSVVARSHHERYDGRGYPDALAGEEIPLEARIVGIADAYDAMSSDRAYRKALPKDIIRKELEKGRGTQFDPYLTDCFIKLFDEGALDTTSSKNNYNEDEVNIAEILDQLINDNFRNGALTANKVEIDKICSYINGIHERYGISYNVVIISLECEDDTTDIELQNAMKAMEYSIVQSLRKVDVVTQISRKQFLVILTEAHSENINTIVERIFAGFYKNCLNTKIKPNYTDIV